MHRRSVAKRQGLGVEYPVEPRVSSKRRLLRKQRRHYSAEVHPVLWVLALPVIFLVYKLVESALQRQGSLNSTLHPRTVRHNGWNDETSSESSLDREREQRRRQIEPQATAGPHAPETSLERRVPVVVQLGKDLNTTLQHVSHHERQLRGPNDWLDDNWDGENCVPMHKWQLHNPSSCNVMHEMDSPLTLQNDRLHIVSCGDSRCAFRVDDDTGGQVALKLVRYNNDEDDDPFYPGGYERARMDALAMDHLHRSPYILDAYASCGTSQLVEYSHGGTLYDQIKVARKRGDFLKPNDKLRIAFQLASGVADLHSTDDSNITTLTHNDLCCHQFILVDGVYKLNDFHSGGYIKKNRKSGKVCKDLPKHISEDLIKMRAPEDLVDLYEDDEDTQLIHRDKTDVYSLGNVLYYLLTNKWIFEGKRNKAARNFLVDGKRSELPERFTATANSTVVIVDPAERAILKAIQTAWTQNPFVRPTAREISDYLEKELHKIAGGRAGDVVRVKVPPLPKDHRFTDSDFRENLNVW